MIHRKINLDKDSYHLLQGGEDVLDLRLINQGNSSEEFNLFISGDALLKIQKKGTKIKKSVVKSIIGIKDLVSPKLSEKLKEINRADRYIKDRILLNTRRTYNATGFEDFYVLLTRRWEKIKKIQEELNLVLLKKDKMGFCYKCNALRQGPALVSALGKAPPKCPICQKEIKSEKFFYSLPEHLSEYIRGSWLEDYVAEKLTDLGWLALPHIYVYGTSGVKFEIDVLAAKEGKILIVECKTGNTGLNELSSFIAKFYDIKAHRALFVSLPKANKEMRNMVKKNRAFFLIDNIKNDNSLTKELKKVEN